MKTWVAVANRSEARFFEINEKNGVLSKSLKLVKRLENPKGRLKNSEINADRPGASATSFTYSRTRLVKQQEPTDRIAQVFAKEISAELGKGCNGHLFQNLI